MEATIEFAACSPLALPSPASRQTAPARAAASPYAGRSKQSKEEKKAAKAEKKKAAPAVSKQAKDAARKKAAAAMREVVSKQGKAYDRMVRELDRDQYREYVLSVRHNPAGDADPEPVLSDWLPVCEVIVADKQQYEVRDTTHVEARTETQSRIFRHRFAFTSRRAPPLTPSIPPTKRHFLSCLPVCRVPQARKFFKENNMDIPETEQQTVSAEQIEGVPAIRAAVPRLGADVLAMAAAMAGSNARNVDVSELEFGVEDWGSFENAVDGLEAQAGAAVQRARAAGVLGVSPDDDPSEVKRVYRRLIATEHPDRNPDASIEKFNAIKEAYELMSDRGGQSGATFEGLGDKAKRDFVKLNDAHAGVSSAGGAKAADASKTEIALRSLTIYDRIKTVFTARNVSLQNRAATAAKAKAGEASEGTADAEAAPEETETAEKVEEPVAA